ncbi:hypothetical protein EVAR_19698_1 [Eumeta japonica]|uniref:Uncharacterized protein n=1 Tax=Eumeta variegata TaxID=151549 RepID=A0A4C1V3C5_EUMVA|nr:hypothetical protein EVAR_19698_1 [Eumeta japonica]
MRTRATGDPRALTSRSSQGTVSVIFYEKLYYQMFSPQKLAERFFEIGHSRLADRRLQLHSLVACMSDANSQYKSFAPDGCVGRPGRPPPTAAAPATR